MDNAELQSLIEQTLPDSQIQVEGDGYHFVATIISPVFGGLLQVKRQQLVYAGLNTYITSGAIHALTLHTYTPAEWEKQHG